MNRSHSGARACGEHAKPDQINAKSTRRPRCSTVSCPRGPSVFLS